MKKSQLINLLSNIEGDLDVEIQMCGFYPENITNVDKLFNPDKEKDIILIHSIINKTNGEYGK